MRSLVRAWVLLRAAGAAAGLWLCAGVAWAGDGQDLGSLQALLSDPNTGLCKLFNMSTCPHLPTVTQAVLQVAALGNNLPEMIRAQNNITPGSSVNAGNPAAVPPLMGSLTPLPLTSTSTPTVSDVLSTLTPLAFISQSPSGTAQATQLYDSNKDTLLYAVGVSSFQFTGATGLTDPDMVYFFYEDISRIQNFSIGQVVAKFSFPLTVLNKDGTERAVPATLQFTATNAGDCSASTVVGDFKGNGTSQTLLANTIGLDCAVVFSPSPASPNNTHAIFEVAIPLLITGACVLPNSQCPLGQTPPGPNTDPAYFYSLHNPGEANPVNAGVYTAFLFDDPGGTPSSSSTLGARGKSIGLAPTAPPFCTTITCPPGSPPPPPPQGSITFALCATLPDKTGAPRSAVGAYYAMATSGEALLSAPLPAAFTSGGTPPVCNPL